MMFRFSEINLNDDEETVENITTVLLDVTHVCCRIEDDKYKIYLDGGYDKTYILVFSDESLFNTVLDALYYEDTCGFKDLNILGYDYDEIANTYYCDNQIKKRREILDKLCLEKNNKVRR